MHKPELDPANLICAWFRSRPNPHFQSKMLWVLVMEAFCLGSTMAREMCVKCEQDPDAMVPGLGDEDGVCAACRSWSCPVCETLSHVSDGCEPECECNSYDADMTGEEVAVEGLRLEIGQ